MPVAALQLNRVPVLMYHKVAPRPSGSLVPHHYVSPRRFQAHVRALDRFGYTAIRLESLQERLEETFAHGKYIALTFDDGYENFQSHAAPVLIRAGMTATVFAVSGLLGKGNEWDIRRGDVEEGLLTAENLKALNDAGFEIGSHSVSHARLTECDDADLWAEVSHSKEFLSAILGRDVPIFCYPYGAQDARVRDAVRKAGYCAACSVEKGWNDKTTDRFQWKRVNVRSDTSTPILFWKLFRQSRRH